MPAPVASPRQLPRTLNGVGEVALWLVAVIGAAAVLLWLPLAAAVLLVAGCALFILTLHRPGLGVAGVVATVPVQASLAIDIGVGQITLTKTALAAVALGWGTRVVVERSAVRINEVAFVQGAFVLALAASILNARDLAAWAGEVYRWAAALLLYLIASQTLRKDQGIAWVVRAMSAGTLALAVHGSVQVAFGIGPPSFTMGGLTRAYATFGEPNPFAGYLELSVPLLAALVLGWVMTARPRDPREAVDRPTVVFAAVAACAGTGALALTQSRGGYLGFAAGMATVIWLTGGRVRRVGTVLGAIAVALLLLSPLGPRLSGSIDDIGLIRRETQVTRENFAVLERSAHWEAAVRMVAAYPVLGVGAGNFDERYRELTPGWRFRIPRGHAHSAYLQAAAQAGLLGFLVYLGLLGVVGRRIVLALRIGSPEGGRPIAIGVSAVTMAVVIHNLFDYLHVLSLGLQLAVVWAMLEAVAPGCRSSGQPSARGEDAP